MDPEGFDVKCTAICRILKMVKIRLIPFYQKQAVLLSQKNEKSFSDDDNIVKINQVISIIETLPYTKISTILALQLKELFAHTERPKSRIEMGHLPPLYCNWVHKVVSDIQNECEEISNGNLSNFVDKSADVIRSILNHRTFLIKIWKLHTDLYKRIQDKEARKAEEKDIMKLISEDIKRFISEENPKKRKYKRQSDEKQGKDDKESKESNESSISEEDFIYKLVHNSL